MKGSLFEGIKKIKAFTSPDGMTAIGEKQVLSNYLTYKLLEKISPYAFKTRLFIFKYIDTSGRIPSFKSKTFLKEPNKNIAQRYKMNYIPFKLESENDPIAMDIKSKINQKTVELITAFEFLAGNWEHSIPGIYSEMYMGLAPFEKNMKMIKDEQDRYYPIAYDFDFSGFIDRGLCAWEVGFNIAIKERSDHYRKIKEKCDKRYIRLHYELDFNEYYYKSNFIKHYPFMKKRIREWLLEYSNYFKELSPNYIQNLNDYLDVLDQLGQN